MRSAANPLVRRFTRLHQKKYRDETGTFLVEGPRLLAEALRAGLTLECAAYTGGHHRLADGHPVGHLPPGVPSYLVGDSVMARLSTLTAPPGIVAIAKMPKLPFPAPTSGPVLLLEGVQDPGNLGTILRTALGAGCREVGTLEKTVDIFHPKVVRGSMGAVFHLRCGRRWRWDDVRELRRRGIPVVAADPRGTLPYWNAGWRNPVAFLLGSEGEGLSDTAMALADQVVAIPLMRGVDSLNVAVAAGVLLFDHRRRIEQVFPCQDPPSMI